MNSDTSRAVPTPAGRDLPAITPGRVEIRVRGKNVQVPSITIQGQEVIVRGGWFRTATLKDEDLVETGALPPEPFIDGLRRSGLGADLFTFAQKLPDVEPHYRYQLEWENAAVVPITTYQEWLEKRVKYDVRKAVRKAARTGVVVRSVPFDDALVRGIVEIYAESPIRQSKAFWHYRKDFATVKKEAGTYLEKCEFIGAYYGEELIGFIKMAHLGRITATIHVIAKKKHFDKKATTALLAKAVEICEQRGSSHLMYGNYVYDDPASSLTEFKSRHGFEMVLLPRYYVPLTLRGRIALALRLHRGPQAMIPLGLRRQLVKARSWMLSRRKKAQGAAESQEKSAPNQQSH